MINREKVSQISELNLAGKIEQMNDENLRNYIRLLYSFVETLPEHDKKIKAALDAKDNGALKKLLLETRDTLEKIYADEMAADCAKQISSLGSIKQEKLDAYIRYYFLSSLSILAADIQKAEYQSNMPASAQKDSGLKSADAPKKPNDKNKIINMEKLLAISELKLDGKIEQMDVNGLVDYVLLLNSFTDDYPEKEEKIKNALKEKNYDAFKKNLSDVRDMLQKIHADEMAKDCTKQIDELNMEHHDKLEAFMRYFLAGLSMLSINIQMAQRDTGTPAGSPPITAPPNNTQDKKLLAVDDTSFFQNILKKTLQDTRYKLTCVTSGREALKFLEKQKADIFLLDIEMPGMDGFELAKRIREHGYKEPIVFVTGNAKKEHLAKAVEAGATDFIIKPINKDILLSKLNKYTG